MAAAPKAQRADAPRPSAPPAPRRTNGLSAAKPPAAAAPLDGRPIGAALPAAPPEPARTDGSSAAKLPTAAAKAAAEPAGWLAEGPWAGGALTIRVGTAYQRLLRFCGSTFWCHTPMAAGSDGHVSAVKYRRAGDVKCTLHSGNVMLQQLDTTAGRFEEREANGCSMHYCNMCAERNRTPNSCKADVFRAANRRSWCRAGA